ncbi:hypothetical protein ECH7EC4196_2225, partial [Escherichia coli O157:H7 str. EC4196]
MIRLIMIYLPEAWLRGSRSSLQHNHYTQEPTVSVFTRQLISTTSAGGA